MKKTLAKTLRSAMALLLVLVMTLSCASGAFAVEVPGNEQLTGAVERLVKLLRTYGPDAVEQAKSYGVSHGYATELKEYVVTLKDAVEGYAAEYGVKKAQVMNLLEGPIAQLKELKKDINTLQQFISLYKAGLAAGVTPEDLSDADLEALKDAGLTGNIDPSKLTDEQIDALKAAGLTGEIDTSLFTEEEVKEIEELQAKLNETQKKADAVTEKIEKAQNALQELEDRAKALVEAVRETENLTQAVLDILEEKTPIVLEEVAALYVKARDKMFAALGKLENEPYTYLDELLGDAIEFTALAAKETKELTLFIATDLADAAEKLTKDDLRNAVGASIAALSYVTGVEEETIVDVLEKAEAKLREVAPVVAKYIDKAKEVVKNITTKVKAYLYAATHDTYEIGYNTKQKLVAIGDGVLAAENNYAEQLAAELNIETDLANGMTDVALIQNLELDEAEIKSADLITIGFGATGFIADAAESVVAGIDWSTIIDNEIALAGIEKIMEEINLYLDVMGIDGPSAESISALIESAAYNALVYAYNLPKTVHTIRSMNEEAVIVVVGMDNPFENCTISHNAVKLPIDKIMDALIETTDLYSLVYAILSSDCIFVNADEAANDAENTNIVALEVLDLYFEKFDTLKPNAKGQTYIKDQILNALTVKYGYKWGDVNLDEEVDFRDAIHVLEHYAEMPISSEGGVFYEPVANVTGDEDIDFKDAIEILEFYAEVRTQFTVEQ